jgi:predicted MFS family arabinose efflux permease
MRATSASTPPRLTLTQVLVCGATIVTLSMGIRHGFGLWLAPITMDRGWTRETFAFAIAVQNLAWGVVGPLAGMMSDRLGAFRVLLIGSLLYAAGLVLMGLATSGLAFTGSAGLLLGMAQAGTTYAVVYGVIGRNVAPEKRSWAMGMTAAAGSFGQFLMVPVENWLIGGFGWQNALFILGCLALAIVPLAFGLREPPHAGHSGPHQSIGQALHEAFTYRSFQLLMAGYFVCGFQVVFIGVHMPSYLKDHGLSPEVATYALALIGLFNVFGTYSAGVLGQRLAKRHILSTIYILRSLAISLLAGAAVTDQRARLLGHDGPAVSTVPPPMRWWCRSSGVRYFSMLSGFVFFSRRSVPSWACGWAASSTTPREAMTWCGGSPSRSACSPR